MVQGTISSTVGQYAHDSAHIFPLPVASLATSDEGACGKEELPAQNHVPGQVPCASGCKHRNLEDTKQYFHYFGYPDKTSSTLPSHLRAAEQALNTGF